MTYSTRTAVCVQCGIEFSGNFSPKRQFCSVACRQAYLNAPDRNPAKRDSVRAKKSEMMRGRPISKGRVQSKETREKIAQSLTGKKQSAETVALRVASWRKTAEPFGGMTPAHAEQLRSIQLSGSDHPLWKGGTTPQRTKEFNSKEYKDFHQAVMERDEYTCQGCGAKQGAGHQVDLQVHHIKSYAEYPELRYEPSNGIVYCRECHLQTIRGADRPSRTDFVPKPRICEHCDSEFIVRNPRKYCPTCRNLICCPVCGSTKCHHSARLYLPYYQTEHHECD